MEQKPVAYMNVDLVSDLPLTHPYLSGCRMALEELGWECKMWTTALDSPPATQWTVQATPYAGQPVSRNVVLTEQQLLQDYNAQRTVARMVRTAWLEILTEVVLATQ